MKAVMKAVIKSVELSDESSLSQDAYLELCSLLFTRWNRYKSRRDIGLCNYARVCRGLLTNVHQLYRDNQACPVYYAKLITKLAETQCYIGFEIN